MEKPYARATVRRRTGAAGGHTHNSSSSGHEGTFRPERGRCA